MFIHIPKTGGCTVYEILDRLKLHRRDCRWQHPPSAIISQLIFRFAFVRHPWPWLVSSWRYATGQKWPRDSYFGWAKSNTFEGFVRNMYVKDKSILTHFYAQFIGPPENRIDFVGRTENLIPDLGKCLLQRGLIENLDVMDQFKAFSLNVSKPYDAKCSLELQQRVLELEKPIIDEFYRPISRSS